MHESIIQQTEIDLLLKGKVIDCHLAVHFTKNMAEITNVVNNYGSVLYKKAKE